MRLMNPAAFENTIFSKRVSIKCNIRVPSFIIICISGCGEAPVTIYKYYILGVMIMNPSESFSSHFTVSVCDLSRSCV